MLEVTSPGIILPSFENDQLIDPLLGASFQYLYPIPAQLITLVDGMTCWVMSLHIEDFQEWVPS